MSHGNWRSRTAIASAAVSSAGVGTLATVYAHALASDEVAAAAKREEAMKRGADASPKVAELPRQRKQA